MRTNSNTLCALVLSALFFVGKRVRLLEHSLNSTPPSSRVLKSRRTILCTVNGLPNPPPNVLITGFPFGAISNRSMTFFGSKCSSNADTVHRESATLPKQWVIAPRATCRSAESACDFPVPEAPKAITVRQCPTGCLRASRMSAVSAQVTYLLTTIKLREEFGYFLGSLLPLGEAY